jgi:hypothetical protein
MATSFSGGRSQSTLREPPTMGKRLVSFITCDYEAKQECSRLSSENGKLESFFFYHFHHSNVFENELTDHINAMFVS